MRQVKKTIDARGRKLGGEIPLVCMPLLSRTREKLLVEGARVIAQKPDMVEWRVDHFDGIGDTQQVIDTAHALRALAGKRPIIFTCRSADDGGERVPISDDQVVDLYAAVAASRCVDLVDYEVTNDPEHVHRVRASTRSHKIRLILSYHNFSYTPGTEFLVQQFLEAERLGADAAMVAVMPRDRADVLHLLAATDQADAKTHIPLISIAMGPLGSVSRMIGGLFGSGMTFAVGEAASAPGQVPIKDLVTVFDIIRRARGGEMY